MIYDKSDILLHVGPRALEAGRIYQRQRRVLEYANGRDTISTRVQGNERRPYIQDIDVSHSAAGKAIIRSECSCPVGSACKHVAAALLEDLAQKSAPFGSPAPNLAARNSAPQPQTQPPKPAAPELPAQLASWLNALEEARQRESEDYPKGQQQRIVYVLAPQTRHDGGVPRLELNVMTTRLLKDGTFSQSAHSFNPHMALHSASPAKYLRPSDFRIFRKFMMARGQYGYYSSESPFADDGGQELLEAILATGRARWLKVGGPSLSLGPARRGRIVWDIGDGASPGSTQRTSCSPPIR